VTSNNGRRLWVNDQLIVDGWIDDTGEYRGKISLVAGQKYDIKLEYFENSSAATCKLEWSNFLQGREVIPMSQFYVSTLGIQNPQITPNIIMINPVDQVLHIISDVDLSSADIRIYDIQGRLLVNPKKYYNDLYVGNLKQGMYLLQIQMNGAKYIKKFIKK
jgi:hypothetical protein